MSLSYKEMNTKHQENDPKDLVNTFIEKYE